MNRKTKLTAIIGVALVLGIAAGWYFIHAGKNPADAGGEAKTERKVLYWTDPMVPGYRSDKPGPSPFMDMDLVPVYADEGGASDGSPVVTIRPEFIQNFGVRTHKVTRGGAARSLTAHGYLFREGGVLLVLVDSFEHAAWVQAGSPAVISFPDFPGREWNGTVESVRSDVDIGTRSLKARIRVINPDAALRPNMYADVVIRDKARRDQKLMVPREALIRTGTRTAVVLALGGGRFQPAEVVPGEESGDWVEIRQGIKEGDTVVTSGQFLIDSEASVRASFQRMESAPADPHAGH
ncbi:RND transporter [Sulfuricaulis limicola]|uniref:RND transporter n=1 Tax=Sulfuricaulis limicola TaxID=1620215 RepID=A0A1B4XDB4_9GAMM|nr:efflux RND transporter periplasmic adaptor subunit [Sulfuricaulis limicola]BAV32791.1 RND transporter [Sulfuricaulis limicola]